MSKIAGRWLAMALVSQLCLAVALHAQVSEADYARAAALNDRYKGLAEGIASMPTWVEGEDVLLYSRTVPGGRTWLLVDAATQHKQPAFDQDRLAKSLSEAQGKPVKALELPLGKARLLDHRRTLAFSIGYDPWRCQLDTYKCAPEDAGHDPEDPNTEGADRNSLTHSKPSPDGRWSARVENYNVVLHSTDGKQQQVLSTDGSEGDAYDFDSLMWSPDSQKLVAYRIRPGYKRFVHYVESSPPTQLQPLYPEKEYTKPGDLLALQQPVLFDVSGKRELPVASTLFPNPFSLSDAEWWKNSRGFTFEYNQRGHAAYRVIEVDAQTGAARTLIDERSSTFVDYRDLVLDQQDTGKRYRKDLADGKEIVWASERDGWEQLYLYNGVTGQVENQITKGPWVVRAVDRVDENKRQVWFEASGMRAGEDPYFVHAYRINFDGTGLTPLTNGPGNHQVSYSEDGKYSVDLVSTLSTAPVLTLYNAADNSRIAELERGDLTKLQAAGWSAPEVFHAKGRDGQTDIWGVVYKPANFDPKKKYPVVEDIYAGPQGSFVPKTFTTRSEPLTQLGFVVAQIDGMGTNNRSRAFHNVAWKNLKDAGFPDRIAWHKAYAAGHPWYDISRVGIFGTSAGGQSAMGALLFHPEFYKVAVSNSGCHDNRMDKIWWNEQWMGWPIGPQYSASSNVDNAWRLQGRLMLVVGELDDNVDPSSTFQVADRLEKANKYFDLLYVPGGHHGAGGAYGERKLEDFFVRYLLGQEPPAWNAKPTTPVPAPWAQ